MNKPWPMVPLGEVISYRKEFIQIDDAEIYKRCRVKLHAQGSTNYAAIRPNDVHGYQIPLPPLPEQKRIVARIEELAAKIEEAKGLRQKAVEEAEALLNSALSKQFRLLTELGRQRQPIAEFSIILRGRGPMYQEGTGKYIINQKCVRWSGIDLIHAKEVDTDWLLTLAPHHLLKENDIIFNSTGEGTIGRVCIVSPHAIGLPFDSHVLVVRTNADKALPIFITYFLRSPIGQAAIEDSKGAKTTKQTELGTSKLGNISIPVPPLPEQRRIVAYLNGLQAKMDLLKRLQDETAKELDSMLPSVLDRAFKGEL